MNIAGMRVAVSRQLSLAGMEAFLVRVSYVLDIPPSTPEFLYNFFNIDLRFDLTSREILC